MNEIPKEVINKILSSSSYSYLHLHRGLVAILIKRTKKGGLIARAKETTEARGENPRIRDFFLSRREGAFNYEFK